ncbi:hypothetical protein ID866_4046 [Astraeus odoratus]|nr:hypothetical protein ID866_4046 [Astraeus odoratus]
MYARSSSPVPPSTQIQPGTITYTTSTGPDGQIIYHPFKAVPASYQTPQGVVHGIQWIPAEATSVLPVGAQPAGADFAASWNRTHPTDDRIYDRGEKSEHRRKREEKESIRRLTKQFEKDREETDAIVQRERRRSFYGDTAPPSTYTPSHPAYALSPSSTTDLDRKFNDLEIERKATSSYTTRSRTYSTTGGERTSIYGAPPAGSGYATSGGYPAAAPTSPYRHSTYPASPSTRPQEFSSYPGGPDPIARAASPYAREPIARAASPYGRAPTEPIARAPSPYGRPPTEPIARAASPYGRAPTEPIARAHSSYGGRAPTEPIARASSPYHSAYVPRAPSPVPPQARTPLYAPSNSPYVPRATSPAPHRAPSPYAKSAPLRPASPYSGAPSPYVPPAQVYPLGHVMEGQPMPRSRAPSPMPGPPAAFPSSPRMPVSVIGSEQQQLTAPEAFSRPANAAQPYTPFATMKIQDMEQFYDQIPRMPLVLDTHDVYHQDWIRFMNDLALSWAGKLPIPPFSSGPPPRRSTLVADLIDLWNVSFFLPRRIEAVLYKGRERRSGPLAGTIDNHLPGFNVESDSDGTSSSSSSSDSEEDLYPGYARGADLTESRRRLKEKKEEKRRRKRERRARRKAKELEKAYTLYITYVPPGRDVAPSAHSYYA